MRSRIIIRFALSFLALFAVGMIIWAKNRHDHRNVPVDVEKMPEIRALTISGDSLKCANFNSHKRTAILFFNPDCEFCQVEIKGILEGYSECRDVQWIFLTLAPQEELQDFLLKYPVDSITDAYLLREDFPAMHISFGVTAPPVLFIYDEYGVLMKKHKGSTSIKTILEELK